MTLSHRRQSLTKHLGRIDRQLATLESLAQDNALCDLRVARISAWSVGEQIEHLRRSDRTILSAVNSEPKNEAHQGSPNLAGKLVLLLGWIPRGKGRAPSATQPVDFKPEELPSGLEKLRREFAGLAPDIDRLANSPATIKHPALGYFSASQMLKFAAIHHRHHMKIVDQIRNAAPTASR